MSADLFDFHRGGDGVEQMKDGEKRKLTLLNPMRNVGLAVNIFFSYSVTSIRGVFSTSRRSHSLWRYCIPLNSAKRAVSGSFCPAFVKGGVVINKDNVGSHFSSLESYSNQKRTLAARTMAEACDVQSSHVTEFRSFTN